MSLVDDTLMKFEERLAVVEKDLAPLAAEAEELRGLIAAIRGKPKAAKPAAKATRKASAKRGRPKARTPRGHTREAVLAGALENPEMTSGQLAEKLGLPRNSVATAMSKLRAAGDLPRREK